MGCDESDHSAYPWERFVEDLFRDRYEVLSQLGSGGTGRVYLVNDRKLNKKWAVKEIRLEGDGAQGAMRMQLARAEFLFLRSLEHESLPGIVDIYEEASELYIVMDYVEGTNLKDYIREKGNLPPMEVARIGCLICDVLEYLHSRPVPVIYRDMKPANIIRTFSGSIKLVDLGGCVRLSDVGRSYAVGTKRYAPPELEKGEACIRSDIFSLGKTMEELLGEGRGGRWLRRVIDRCLREEPEKRYASAGMLKRALKTGALMNRIAVPASAAGIILAALLIISGVSGSRDGRSGLFRSISENIPKEAVSESVFIQNSAGDAERGSFGDSMEGDAGAFGENMKGDGGSSEERMAAFESELSRVGEMLKEAGELAADGDIKSSGSAVALLEKAGRKIGWLEDQEIEGHISEIRTGNGQKGEDAAGEGNIEEEQTKEGKMAEELRNYKIEDLSMISAIYKLLGQKSAAKRRECYGKASQCIEELFTIKGVRESPLYRVKLSDLVSMKDELGEKEEALRYLRSWEKDNPGEGKELYYTHALILLREPGNKKEIKELLEGMKASGEVREDFRFPDMKKRIEKYINEGE